jgi:hypothetical protein
MKNYFRGSFREKEFGDSGLYCNFVSENPTLLKNN